MQPPEFIRYSRLVKDRVFHILQSKDIINRLQNVNLSLPALSLSKGLRDYFVIHNF